MILILKFRYSFLIFLQIVLQLSDTGFFWFAIAASLDHEFMMLLWNIHKISTQLLNLIELILNTLIFALHLQSKKMHFLVWSGDSQGSSLIYRLCLGFLSWWRVNFRLITDITLSSIFKLFVIIYFSFKHSNLFLELLHCTFWLFVICSLVICLLLEFFYQLGKSFIFLNDLIATDSFEVLGNFFET